MDEFIKGFQGMYDGDGKSGLGGAAGGGNGDPESPLRYDPKARAFVGKHIFRDFFFGGMLWVRIL